ncbi:probable sodium-coupled neutral amino acid transporter 6 [Pectinophora gossypiella]|uniref:probable sodium-coupled neutral amino acid transporter 6 n=1 Tax=Pectinophora gossypiella TaxID=13191 RepID=UPI00214E4BC3|nr:probable sodium-coupled neutral amino acid transporter 6 [Pectinophora gossypiella]XP_049879992.1 probable sodium-coupled neutral amino acid transporter 6 [Pectinophora gossypiella]
MKLPRLDSHQGSLKARVVVRHEDYSVGQTTGGLSVLFSTLCIVDLFGVFPVVALPKPVISCGVYGAPLVIGVFGLQLYTAVLLGRSWLLAQEISPLIKQKIRFPYAAVAELAFGQRTRQLVTFLLDATVFGAGVPNFIFASQSLQLFWWKITGGGVGISYCVWMLVLGLLLCPVMWLGSPKDMKPLAVLSVVIVITVATSCWSCILLDDVTPPAPTMMDYQPSAQDFLVAYGIIAFQFDIHPMLLTIQVDMKDSRRVHWAALGGFLFTGALFAVTTLLAAARYGNHVESNLLQGIPPSVPLYVVALLVTLQLCLSSAVGNSALFQHIEDLLKIPREFCLQRCLVRSSIVALAVFLGESVPRFDLVMGLVGSTLTGPLMFIFPPLFFLRLCYMKSNMIKHNLKIENGANGIQNGHRNGDSSPLNWRSVRNTYSTFSNDFIDNYVEKGPIDQYSIKWYDVMLAVIVMLMGVAATIVATYSSWSDTITSATFTPPCLSNMTAAARSFLEVTRPM